MTKIEPSPIPPFFPEATSPNSSSSKSPKADPEHVSAYYLSTLFSLDSSREGSFLPEKVQESLNTQLSNFEKFRQWVSGLIWGAPPLKNDPVEISNEQSHAISALSGVPKLDLPQVDKERLAKAISELNRDLIHRLKETADFEEEMRKSNSKQMDKLIFVHLFDCAMKQKHSTEETSMDKQETIIQKQQENKKLQQEFFSLWKDIQERSKKSALLGWINLGSTIGVTVFFAASFATGGAQAFFAGALPLLSLVQGGTKAAEGVLKYKNDLKSGKFFLIKEENSENATTIQNGLTEMKSCDDLIARVLKQLRRIVDNQMKTERMFTQK